MTDEEVQELYDLRRENRRLKENIDTLQERLKASLHVVWAIRKNYRDNKMYEVSDAIRDFLAKYDIKFQD